MSESNGGIIYKAKASDHIHVVLEAGKRNLSKWGI
jgi:hypothetical protein